MRGVRERGTESAKERRSGESLICFRAKWGERELGCLCTNVEGPFHEPAIAVLFRSA